MHGRSNFCSISNESHFIFPDNYGIIRDIVQNHLLQVLTLLAMEAPTKADGPSAGETIRNAKVQVLNAIPPITMDECFLGQYEGTIYIFVHFKMSIDPILRSPPFLTGYTDDETITNKDSNTATFVAIRCFVHTRKYLRTLRYTNSPLD